MLRENQPPLSEPGGGRPTGVTAPTHEAVSKLQGGAQVLVAGFRFVGNEHIDSDELMREVPPAAAAVGQRLDLADLETVADAVTRYYRARGYVVAVAYIAPQAIDDGVVAITVLEGLLGRSAAVGAAGYDDQRLARYMDRALCGEAEGGCGGAAVMRSRVERATGLIADLPGIADVTGTLAPGSRTGATDLTLHAVAGRGREGLIGLDNHGNRTIGRERVTAGLRLNNPAGIGDALGLDVATTGRHMASGGIEYSVPVGYDGWRAGVRYAHLLYRLKPPFDVIDATGRADSLDVFATYPIVRSLAHNLYFRAGYGGRWLKDKVLDGDTRTRLNTLEVGLSGNAVDRWLGGGFSAYGVTVSRGRLSQDGLAAGEGGAERNATRLGYNLLRDQTLADPTPAMRFSLYGALRGQYSDDRLASVESFALGGPAGVRAYPVGEAPGDRGYVVTAELRLSMAVPVAGGSDLSFALFRDQGASTAMLPQARDTHRRLAGNGLSVALNRRDAYQIKLTWAARDRGSERASSDRDARSRLWLQATYVFL